ncbi:PIG-L family deacetylase [Chloroflexia bacterium SDU3-3]|nr:PIG-L family deacetylase [Chloroflexia bacterium SDU3-3]
MQYTYIDQIPDVYKHIYISPHLDDAALSCGGAIARHTSQGDRVLVVTIATAAPAAEGPFSEFAAAMHGRWQLSPEHVVASRLQEDTLALERIGADSYWAGFLDAIYRIPDTYCTAEALFGRPAITDPLRQQLAALLDELHARASGAMFYVPLAVGGHVDHQLTYDATVAGGWASTTAFYEDVPYALKAGALEQRLGALPRKFVPSIIDIDATLSRKIGSIASYASQMGELFGGEDAMRKQIIDYHEQLRPEVGTYGERVWVMI